ncbi:hsp90 co-chaperone Cdc37 [Phlyctochytrium bullatum]|nr:hsp90 co-chaperone Cdc37 [Phlyctochytrium bullatum]
MPQGINYSKWDNLELSDDDDFEASMVRWRQADLHRKRRDRRDKLEALKMELAFSSDIAALLSSIPSTPSQESLQQLAKDIQEKDDKLKHDVMVMAHTDRDPRWQPPTPDPFFMKRVDVVSIAKKLEEALGENVQGMVKDTLEKLEKRREEVQKEIQREEAEINKKITTETIREGFSKTVVSKGSAPSPSATPQDKAKKTVTTKTTEIITLNNPSQDMPSAAVSAESTTPSPPKKEVSPEASEYITDANLEVFSNLPPDFEKSFQFLLAHPYLAKQNFSDEVLAQAFHLEMQGKRAAARRCVHQSLILQYCDALGADGIRLFFARMGNATHRAREMFGKDVKDTYERIAARVVVLKEEEKKKEEERKKEEEEERRVGEARVKEALQEDGSYKLPVGDDASELEKRRAEVFAQFPRDFQRAILLQDVDEINAALQNWDRAEAGELLKKADEVGLITLQEEDDDAEGAGAGEGAETSSSS